MQLFAAPPPNDEQPAPEATTPSLNLVPVNDDNRVLGFTVADLELNNIWGVYTLKSNGLAAAYGVDEIEEKLPITRTPDGVLIAADEVVAYQHPVTMTILPAIRAPHADGREKFIKDLANIMTKLNMYCFQGMFHQYVNNKFVPIDDRYSFDSWIARSIIIWSLVPTKEDGPELKLVHLQERTVKQLFKDPGLKALLPQVDMIHEVQQPYFVDKSMKSVSFHPLGYNPDTRTLTLGTTLPKKTSKKATDRWFKKLIKDYEFQDKEYDLPAILCQLIGTYCSDLFYDFDSNGQRSERYITPIVMVDSNATGSGKTTLMKLMSLPALGITTETIADKPDEIEKIMTSKLKKGERYLYLDEAERVVSKSLLTVVTGRYEGRVLQQSETVSGDITLMLSGCNVEFNEMLARRVICCKLWTSQDPDKKKLSRVIEKGDFTRLRPLMLTYVRNLVLLWIKQGCPLADGNNNWNRYARIVGGILQSNGYKVPFEIRAGAAILPKESSDAQLPDYVSKLSDGTFNIGGKEWKSTEIPMFELRRLLQNAGYYEWVREDVQGLRSLGKYLKPWINSPRQVIPGIWLRSRHTMNGKVVWFTEDRGAKPQYKLTTRGLEDTH